MTFKDIVQSHPLSILILTVIGTAGVAGGTVQWFAIQNTHLKQQIHEKTIKSIKTKRDRTIEDLKIRLLSIERRVGGENLFLDVTKIPIPTFEVRTLSKDYVGYSEGRFYVSVPKFGSWNMKELSQLNLAAQMFGDQQVLPKPASDLSEVLGEKNIVVWQPENALSILASSPMGERRVSLVPSVMVMPISQEYISRVSRGVFEMLDDTLNRKREINDLFSILAKITDDGASEPDNPSDNSKDPTSEGHPNGQDTDEKPIAELDQILDALSGAFSGDLAAFALSDAIQRGFLTATILGGHYRVQAADKKGNVLYLRAQTILDKVQVDGGNETARVYLDEEFFYFGVGNRGMLVRITVPSTDLRSDAYAWTQAWLVSLRISVEKL